MLSACAPRTGFWINPTAHAGQDQDPPSNETIAETKPHKNAFQFRADFLKQFSEQREKWEMMQPAVHSTLQRWLNATRSRLCPSKDEANNKIHFQGTLDELLLYPPALNVRFMSLLRDEEMRRSSKHSTIQLAR